MPCRYKAAVALEYDHRGNGAPTVSVSGDQVSPDEIVKIARRFGIPVIEKPHLARALSSVAPGEAIPEKLFEAVALVLCEIDRQSR